MAFNIPSAWNPGFALPDNVEDEGLERRAFITKMLPRGSYDAPKVGTGGYAVPGYVMDESYGQGTYTTKWQPNGTYNGPKIPNWLNQRPKVVSTKRLPGGAKVATIQSLGDASASAGDTPMPPALQAYGDRAAAVIMGRVAMLPQGQRQQAMRALMDAVDKTLWARTNDIWKRYITQGMAPAVALPVAISRAMSAGVAAEIFDVGRRRVAPQVNSLLGLGCYGCDAALGALGDAAPGNLTGVPLAQRPLCPGTVGYSWVWSSDDHSAGYWTRTRKGQADVPGPCTDAGVATQPITGRVSQDDVTMKVEREGLKIGPFVFPGRVKKKWGWLNGEAGPGEELANSTTDNADFVISDPARIPAEWAAWLHDSLTSTTDENGNAAKMGGYMGSDIKNHWPEWDATPWFAALNINADTPIGESARNALRTGARPFFRTKHPKTGEDLILMLTLNPKDWWDSKGKVHYKDAATNPLVMKVWLAKMPRPDWISTIIHAVMFLPSTMIDLLKEAVNDLGDLACDLLNTPGVGAGAGAVAGSAAGVGPQAGATAGQVGTEIAKNLCGTKKPTAPPPTAAASSMLPWLLIGGAALAAVLLTRGD